jgi:succinate-semialdehyde dehydrogenase/glutarate-semialdehyde dehydrogenase
VTVDCEDADVTKYAVVDPADGRLVLEYPTASDDDVARAVASAHSAYEGWARHSSVDERAALLRRVAGLHVEQRDDLARIIVRETGKFLADALSEVDFTARIYEYYADNASTFLRDEPIELIAGAGSALIRRSPLGAILGVMPWNYPYYQVGRFAAPNLALGNAVIVKHAPQCPESAAALERLFHEAGFPEGAYVNLYATNDQVADLIADPRVQGVSLTGSDCAGAAIAEVAGRHVKKVVLELGGSNPFVLLSTADLDGAVEAAASARLDNTGQSCNAAKRFVVLDELYDAFLEKFTKRLFDADLAPLSSEEAAVRLEQQVRRAVRQGATLVSAGERRGAHFSAAVLTGVAPENEVYREELFGPVAMVFRVASEDEAVRLANDSPYGLGAYVFTTDPDQAARVTDRLDAGMVFVNGARAAGVELPFGGVKRSGIGRELGRLGIEEFVNKKLVRVLA